jgi:hypothetical protein
VRKVGQLAGVILLALFLAGCGEQAAARRQVREIGPSKLRAEVLDACRAGFAANAPQKIPSERWPDSIRVFNPAALWAEPDGAYVLLDSDADGERGIYLPRILSDKDPLCGPTLRHVKWAEGVYWYEKKRI